MSEQRIITAGEGKIFRRKHDKLEMGESIYLGYDYSTGEKRLDLPEYYVRGLCVRAGEIRLNFDHER